MRAQLEQQRLLQRWIGRSFENFKKMGKDNFTAAKVRSRIATLQEHWAQFQAGHLLILKGTTEEARLTMDYFTECQFDATEESYQNVRDALNEILEALEPVVSPSSALHSTSIQQEMLNLGLPKMPPIKLPPFDGQYSEWENFRDRFSALVIENQALSDFARMHYLSSSLKGSALDCIAGIPVTAHNFNVAWSAIKRRFENKRRLISTHFSALLGLKPLQRESATDLQALCDRVQVAVSALNNLGRNSSDLWEDFLVHLVTQNLDPSSRKAWNLKTSDEAVPSTYDDINKFLLSRCRALEECGILFSAKPGRPVAASRVHVATAVTSTISACPLCKARHYLSACSRFVSMLPRARQEAAKKYRRCTNCLSATHALSDCKSKYTCRICNKRHHSMLHSDTDVSTSGTTEVDGETTLSVPGQSVNTLFASTGVRSTQVLLATARVKVQASTGRSIVVRALLDQGSEATFASETLIQQLRAKRRRIPISITAVGGIPLGQIRQVANVTVSPVQGDSSSFTTTALILSTLTSYAPRRGGSLTTLRHLSRLQLADPDPTSSDPIHMIIGADLYGDVILDGVRKGMSGDPVAQNTVFGWIISGPLSCAPSPQSPSAQLTVHHCAPEADLESALRRFWEIEELPAQQFLTPAEERCENHFRATHSRASDGRYIVRLPFIAEPPLSIGQSRHIAATQLSRLIRRLKTQPTLHSEYNQFLSDYETLNHMRRAPPVSSTSQTVYIPHHPVIKTDSATTRLRVVFNASSATCNGTSLNDFLSAGPKLQTELPAILLQWRQFKFVYTADIAKMFRQILIDDRDLDYQRILWQPNGSDSVCEFQLLTVTYGMKSAPFLALRVLQCLADDEGSKYPLAVPILRKQIYVDDVLFGDHDVNNLKLKRDQLVSLLRCGRFELRKWASNSALLLDDIDAKDHGLACDRAISVNDSVKVLGIVWSPKSDDFRFRVELQEPFLKTKRSVLSIVARLYDPLGWATPVTVRAKILLQSLWRLRLDWDSPLPEDFMERWAPTYLGLEHLNSIGIPRWSRMGPGTRVELHGFADASTLAYAAAVYLRVVQSNGDIAVMLLAGKSKVAPVKPLTVPRLELSAALLLSRLIVFIRDTLELSSSPCTCWSDSQVVRAWLRDHPSRWQTFVANRVYKIQESLPGVEWRYVSTGDNPADCASRGILGSDLLTHSLWWHGPPWLSQTSDRWPSDVVAREINPPEQKQPVTHHTTSSASSWDLASQYSSWSRLLRVTAYVIKFGTVCRRKTVSSNVLLSPYALSVEDVSRARDFWIRDIQSNLFAVEIAALISRRPIPNKSALASLCPFLDSVGILRVGGRLRNAPLPYDRKHPILLASHQLVELIIRGVHLRTLHGGLQLTLRTLRQEFWLLRARGLVKSVIHACVICVRERANVPVQLMGNFPVTRVTPPPRSFTWCGVDYAGPVKVRASAGRGITARKAYIALFICLSTRAIHLELVGDYSSAAFLGAFVRFCSRRGLPRAVYSDNGTNFVGADKELRAAHRSALRDPNLISSTAVDGVSWHFIPPSAPHFGGLWEAGVRSVKHHLRRVIGDRTLTVEEFTTVLCRIEACLNSRPIAALSDSYEDYNYLTPGHFLIGSAVITPPEPSVLTLSENRLTRWQIVQHISERFWHLWASDYINTLQQRAKWRKPSPPIKLGQLVLLRNANLPPDKWELGRIVKLHPGTDGLIRVVTVKTASTTYVRPIVKICLLPVESDSTSS